MPRSDNTSSSDASRAAMDARRAAARARKARWGLAGHGNDAAPEALLDAVAEALAPVVARYPGLHSNRHAYWPQEGPPSDD